MMLELHEMEGLCDAKIAIIDQIRGKGEELLYDYHPITQEEQSSREGQACSQINSGACSGLAALTFSRQKKKWDDKHAELLSSMVKKSSSKSKVKKLILFNHLFLNIFITHLNSYLYPCQITLQHPTNLDWGRFSDIRAS